LRRARRAGRRTAARACRRPSRDRCRLSRPELLCDAGAPGSAARHRPRQAPPSREDHPHPMSAADRYALAAEYVFDGAALQHNCAVVIEGERIAALMPRRELPNNVPLRRLPEGAWLVPGFIDVQVNGGGDVLFNDEPTPEGIAAIVATHRRF